MSTEKNSPKGRARAGSEDAEKKTKKAAAADKGPAETKEETAGKTAKAAKPAKRPAAKKAAAADKGPAETKEETAGKTAKAAKPAKRPAAKKAAAADKGPAETKEEIAGKAGKAAKPAKRPAAKKAAAPKKEKEEKEKKGAASAKAETARDSLNAAAPIDGSDCYTDEELIALDGNEDEYMNPKMLNTFRKKLLEMAEEIKSRASGSAAQMRQREPTPDEFDMATLEEEHALEMRIRNRESNLLMKINGSLRQIEDGSYGYCLDTGEAIGVRRLIARPTATLTLEAQQRREQIKRQYAD